MVSNINARGLGEKRRGWVKKGKTLENHEISRPSVKSSVDKGRSQNRSQKGQETEKSKSKKKPAGAGGGILRKPEKVTTSGNGWFFLGQERARKRVKSTKHEVGVSEGGQSRNKGSKKKT